MEADALHHLYQTARRRACISHPQHAATARPQQSPNKITDVAWPAASTLPIARWHDCSPEDAAPGGKEPTSYINRCPASTHGLDRHTQTELHDASLRATQTEVALGRSAQRGPARGVRGKKERRTTGINGNRRTRREDASGMPSDRGETRESSCRRSVFRH